MQSGAPPCENVPFPHGRHDCAPNEFAGWLYVPAAHQGQAEVLALSLDADPGKHRWQSSSAVSEQNRQDAYSLYLPAPHWRHVLMAV
jgi:hypothetical protein